MIIAIKTLTLLLIFALSSCGQTNSSNNELGNKIDNLFKQWDNDITPGGAVAIIKNGEILYKQGYGLANMEHNIPISPSSIFHIASLSKQVTAFAIVLLQQQGKLSLDDDIRQHLPYVPDFGSVITIRHLIHHTSGLRDQWQLLSIAGTRIDDVIKQEHVVKLVSNQKQLNFDPGERYMYCNTGYSLLAEIVKEVSGQSLREFTEQEIFEPLGMKNTHFHDNYQEVVKNRVSSYSPIDDSEFENSVLSYSTVGATSLFTTVEDEALWLNNYFTGQVGGQEAIKRMYQRGILNSGDTLNYAFGLVVDTYKGNESIGHGGADAGFRANSLFFPAEQLAIVVFSNVGDFNPRQLAYQVADLLLEDRSQNETDVKIDKSIAASIAGRYHNDEGLSFNIMDSTKLYAKHRNGTDEMVPTSDSTFTIANGSGTLTFKTNEPESLEFRIFNNYYLLHRTEINPMALSELKAYAGTYRSSEAGTKYEIRLESNELVLGHSKYEDVGLTRFANDQFSSPHWWMSNLVFVRDSVNNVNGFEVNGGRVLHLNFAKLSN